jgi:hypothetical protein
VHFALLTAISLWDEAMDKAEANRKKLAEIEAERQQARAAFEVERAKREAAAKQSAPWQDESWSADNTDEEDESIGEEVEWNRKSIQPICFWSGDFTKIYGSDI